MELQLNINHSLISGRGLLISEVGWRMSNDSGGSSSMPGPYSLSPVIPSQEAV